MEGAKGGCGGETALETELGESRAKAAFREEPPSRATLPATIRSQMLSGSYWLCRFCSVLGQEKEAGGGGR